MLLPGLWILPVSGDQSYSCYPLNEGLNCVCGAQLHIIKVTDSIKNKGFLLKRTAIASDFNTGNFCGLFRHNYPQPICKIAWLVAALRLPCFGVSWSPQEKSSECLCLDFFSMPSKTFLICMCFLKLSALFLKQKK